MPTIKDNIELLRKSKGLTQEDVAKKIGTPRNNYIRIINRKNDISISQLEKIAWALEVPISKILLGDELQWTRDHYLSLFYIIVRYWLLDIIDNFLPPVTDKINDSVLELKEPEDLEIVKKEMIELWKRQNYIASMNEVFFERMMNDFFTNNVKKILFTRTKNSINLNLTLMESGIPISMGMSRNLG